MEDQEARAKGQAGRVFATLSRELGWPDRDYLRQVIRWGDSADGDRKEDFYIPDDYRQLVREVLDRLDQQEAADRDPDAKG